MNNSQLFKQAHAMTKQVIKTGDSYQVTFGLCLKAIKAEQTVKMGFVAVIFITLLAIVKNILDEAQAAINKKALSLPFAGDIVTAYKGDIIKTFEVVKVHISDEYNGFYAKDTENNHRAIFSLKGDKITDTQGFEFIY